MAGQLAEAAFIPEARLGLLAGVQDTARPGRPSKLARALKRLEDASLMEGLQEGQVRLRPRGPGHHHHYHANGRRRV